MKLFKKLSWIFLALLVISCKAHSQQVIQDDKLSCRLWKVGATTVIDSGSMQIMQGAELVGDSSTLYLLLRYLAQGTQIAPQPITCLSNGVQSSLVATEVLKYVEKELQETIKIMLDTQMKKQMAVIKEANVIDQKFIVESLVSQLSINADLIKNLRAALATQK